MVSLPCWGFRVQSGTSGAFISFAWMSGKRAWISNHIHTKQWDVVTHPCHNFNGRLDQSTLSNRMDFSLYAIEKYACDYLSMLQSWFICQKKRPQVPITESQKTTVLKAPVHNYSSMRHCLTRTTVEVKWPPGFSTCKHCQRKPFFFPIQFLDITTW